MTSYLQYLYNSGTPILRLLNYSGNSNKGQIDISNNSLHISSMGNGTGINTAPDSNYTLKVGGKAYFTGAITTPTPATTSNDTTVATTAYVTSKIAASNALSATTATNLASAPSLAASGNNITVTAGGKTSSAFTVPYATKAGSATTATTATSAGSATNATNATNVTGTLAINISGNTIRIQCGNKYSNYITVPYATAAGSATTATSANRATTATTADGVKNVRDNAQIKVWVGTTAQLPSSRAANTIYMTY